MRIILFLSVIVMFSCTDNENEYMDTVMENKPQQERVVSVL